MQKPLPLVLLLILGVSALVVSRKHPPQEAPAPVKSQAAVVRNVEETKKPEPKPDSPPSAIPEPAKPPITATADTPTAAPATPTAPHRAWPHESSDISADPKAVFGTLPNGFHYIIFPNHEPPGRVSFRLHVASGSLMESEGQRGLAHFIEHMVFGGTRHFSREELVPGMQRLGIGFGAHMNAYISR